MPQQATMSFGESLKGAGLGSINLYLQNATKNASEKCCNLRDVKQINVLHIAKMNEVDRKSGNLLRAWREHRRLTQDALATRIGTTPAVISLLEAGDRKLSPKWLYKIAPVFGITPGWLLDHSPDDIDASIDQIWRTIPETQRHIARDVLVAFTPEPRTGTDD